MRGLSFVKCTKRLELRLLSMARIDEVDVEVVRSPQLHHRQLTAPHIASWSLLWSVVVSWCTAALWLVQPGVNLVQNRIASACIVFDASRRYCLSRHTDIISPKSDSCGAGIARRLVW
jgi:hypothetical protein